MSLTLKYLAAGHCTNHENMVLAGGRRMTVKFWALVGVIHHPRHGVILFDTGYADHVFKEMSHFPGNIYGAITPIYFKDEESIANQLRARGIDPADVGLVILSHFHADHVAGAKDFPKARFICYESVYQRLSAMGSVRALTHGFLPGLLPADFQSRADALEQGRRVELPERMRPFTTGVDLLGDRSLIAVDLPGHALGHFGLLIDVAPHPHFLVGDACWHERSFKENLMPHWLPQRILFPDRHAYKQTLDGLHQLHLGGDDLVIVPAHCSATYERLVER